MARAIVVKKASRTAAGKPVASPVGKAKPKAAARVVATTLPAAMTGRASPAKAEDGDEPVFAYIRSLPQPQRGIAERVDALTAKALPALQRSVKWGMAWYGVGDGWCFCCGGFAGHVKLTFGRGTALKPVPPVRPVGMGKDSRGVDLESVDDLNERQAAYATRTIRGSTQDATDASLELGRPDAEFPPDLNRAVAQFLVRRRGYARHPLRAMPQLQSAVRPR